MHVRAGKEGMMPREGRLDDAAADPGWADLTRFLEHGVGLSAGPLQRVVTLLAEEDVTNLFLLRTTFDQLPLKLGSRKLIAGALKAAAANAAPQQAASEPPAPAQLIVHAFHVLVGFKEQSVTLLLALPENDYCGQQVSHVLEQLNVQAAQQLSGAYTIVGLSTGGSRLAKEKSLRDQSVQPGAKLSAVVEGISAVHALARAKGKLMEPAEPTPKPTTAPKPEPKPPPQPARVWTEAQRAAAAPAGNASTHQCRRRASNPDVCCHL
jgi:hypothetical protein